MQSQQIISGGRYLSCDQAMRVFAAGSLTNLLRLEWIGQAGDESVLKDMAATISTKSMKAAAAIRSLNSTFDPRHS